MENSQVMELEKSVVVPSTPTSGDRRHLFLPAMDALFRDVDYTRRVIFYSLPYDKEYVAAVEKLKASLSLVLVQFFPFAGRFAVDENGRLFIDCNDLGVEFVEAALPEVCMSDLELLNFQMMPLFTKLVPWEDYPRSEIFNLPLLSVQVTRFKCGGIAVGLAHQHAVADGSSMWHFMNSWAECARGVPIAMPPLHMRTVLRIDSSSQKTARLQLFEDMEETQQDAGMDLSQGLFHFSAEAISKLKRKAQEDEDGNVGFTSYEVLCAHIWKSIMKAYGHGEARKVGFVVVANFRNRITPPLPANYFGNALNVVGIAITAGELGKESISATARRIHEAVSTCCSETSIRGMQHWLHLHDAKEFLRKVKPSSVRMRVSSSPRFPVYGVDFGWGRPAAVRSAKVEEEGKLVMFGGRHEVGSVDIAIALPHHIMHNLQTDPHFLTIF